MHKLAKSYFVKGEFQLKLTLKTEEITFRVDSPVLVKTEHPMLSLAGLMSHSYLH